jgi:hypothetical protein
MEKIDNQKSSYYFFTPLGRRVNIKNTSGTGAAGVVDTISDC